MFLSLQFGWNYFDHFLKTLAIFKFLSMDNYVIPTDRQKQAETAVLILPCFSTFLTVCSILNLSFDSPIYHQRNKYVVPDKAMESVRLCVNEDSNKDPDPISYHW